MFDVGIGPQCDDDDIDTFCENVLYNLTTNDTHDGVNEKLGLAQDDVMGMTIEAIIGDWDFHGGDHLADYEFIDDGLTDEDDNEYEYNDNE